MAIVSGYQKMKDYIKQSSGYKLISRWANANTLECDDGKTLQSKVGGISGISSSLTANSTTQAASTNLTNQLYQNINSKKNLMSRRDEDLHSVSFDWQDGGFQCYVDVTKVFDSKSFQTGVNTLYNKCVSCGVTPADKSPTAISNAIQNVFNSGYNAGKKDGGFSSATDISSKITGYASQNHGFRSSENLSTYKYIVVCATYQKNKTANFSNFSGCSCLKQITWIANGDSTDAVSTHLVILHNITGAINVWANSVGTGNHEVGAFGLK